MVFNTTSPTSKIYITGAFSHFEFEKNCFQLFFIDSGFKISQEIVDERSLMDSFVSPPSRYIFEIVKRMLSKYSDCKRILVFNPLLRQSEFLIRKTLSVLLSSTSENAVIYSSNGLPIAYLINVSQRENYRHLLLLSCSLPATDAKLLATLYFCHFSLIEVPFPCLTIISHGFLPGTYWLPMEWCAKHALEVLNHIDDISLPIKVRRERRDTVKLCAFSPHHAGDVLFLSIAANNVSTPIYDEVLINDAYFPITKRLNTSVHFSSISGPIPSRGGYKKEDDQQFLEVAPSLPSDSLYVYCRTSRNYNFTNFHMIDHFRFCLGESLIDEKEIHHGTAEKSTPIRNDNIRDKTILLHFDAGWSLKIYPQHHQQSLVSLLQADGNNIITLDAAKQFSGVENVHFSSLDDFDLLLDRVDVMVGMDSFPIHYAAHIKKKRTIHLFSSTHPTHSNAGSEEGHRFLHRNQKCCPCLGRDRCIKYGGEYCHNFSTPEDVFYEVNELLHIQFPIKLISQIENPPAGKCPLQFRPTELQPIKLDSQSLSKTSFPRQVAWAYFELFLTAVSSMIREFINVVRHDGWRKASALTLSFLIRQFRGRNLLRN